ncbi:MAG TPA: hypothetical protein VFA81_13165, partial [Burkholderiales bacterium]|nr:hypothetical protein [Burkholderiales bacterium]
DVDGGAPSYSIVGGADAALFSINASTGVLTFNGAPNFEAPADAGADNVYDVTVQVSDGNGGINTQAISLSVTNANDAPFGLPTIVGSAVEQQTLVADASSISDADGLGPFGYQWLRNGAPVAGATAPSYVLGTADVGAQISVRVSYVDGLGTVESMTSAPSSAVAGSSPLLPTPAVGRSTGTQDPILTADLPPPPAPASTESTSEHRPPAAPSREAGATNALIQRSIEQEIFARSQPQQPAAALTRPPSTLFADLNDRNAKADVFVGTLTIDDYLLRLVSLNTDGTGSQRGGREFAAGDILLDPASHSQASAYELLVHTAEVLGISLTAGTVWWALRMSGLFSSLLASLPAWRQLDLLPILPDDDESEDRWSDADDEDHEALRDERTFREVVATRDTEAHR